MWGKILSKFSNAAVIGYTGYEFGRQNSQQEIIVKLPENQATKSSGEYNILIISLVLLLVILFSVIFVACVKACTIIRKAGSRNSIMEMQTIRNTSRIPHPEP